jgi:hypothetical protein
MSWGAELPSRNRLIETFEGHAGAGVGMALGPESGVIDFEIDGPFTGPELPPTLGWLSARGGHRIFRWDKRLTGLPAVVYLADGAAEVRIGGEGKQTQSVCPPTVGDNRRRRAWNGVWEVAPFPEALLKAMEKPITRRVMPIVVPSGTSRYADAALRYEAAAVARAVEGTRNRTLNKSAFSLGTLVGAGWLDRGVVETALLEAAQACGLPESEARATIRSGLNAGEKHPRA